MKKLFCISFAFLILLSGMHLSVATHFCGGEIAAVKWSFSGKKATCGMENSNSPCPAAHYTIASNCCHNKVAVYTVDNNYTPSSFQIKELSQNVLQVFYIPVSLLYHPLTTSIPLFTNVNPPGELLTSTVSLTDICVFRI